VIAIHVTNEQTLPVDQTPLRRAVRMILHDASIPEAAVSVAIVDDPTIHQLNRRYLHHDDATDVLSFLLQREEDRLEGEVVVSAETAQRVAPQFGWSPADELLLYVIHGTLHLVGYDDQTPGQRAAMREEERAYLARFGLQPRYDEPDPEGQPPSPVAGEG
jgi:probable rRNA maturation factor